jgi:hypothetical protein
MNAHGPPVKTKRGSRLMPATPSCFELTDHTPLICGAQTWCEHRNTRIELVANGPHHAKEICTDCGRLLRWIAKPANTERQQFNSYRIAKLAMADGLNDWEREFLKSIATRPKLSPKQQAKLDELCDEFQIGDRK